MRSTGMSSAARACGHVDFKVLIRNIRSSLKVPSSTICSRSRWVTFLHIHVHGLITTTCGCHLFQNTQQFACMDNIPVSSKRSYTIGDFKEASSCSVCPVNAHDNVQTAHSRQISGSLYSSPQPSAVQLSGCCCAARAAALFRIRSPRIRPSYPWVQQISFRTRSMAGPVPTSFESPSAANAISRAARA